MALRRGRRRDRRGEVAETAEGVGSTAGPDTGEPVELTEPIEAVEAVIAATSADDTAADPEAPDSGNGDPAEADAAEPEAGAEHGGSDGSDSEPTAEGEAAPPAEADDGTDSSDDGDAGAAESNRELWADDDFDATAQPPRDRTRTTQRPRRRDRLTPRRWLPFLALLAVVAAVVVGAGRDLPVEDTRIVKTPGEMIPVAAPSDAISTAFFCPGGTTRGEGGPVELSLVIANGRGEGTTAEVVLAGDDGTEATTSIDVPAYGSTELLASDHIESTWTAATVEVMGGDVSVEQRVEGPLGYDLSPCPTSPADEWFIPSGSTAIGATQQILIYNPFPAPAIASVSFATESGTSSPRALRSITINGRSLRVLNAEDLPPRREQIATTITTRSGQVVVGRIQRYDGEGADIPAERDAPAIAAPTGLASAVGLPRASTRWVFPGARNDAEVRNAVAIFNPSERDAEVSLWLFYEDRSRNAEIEPVAVSVRAGQQTVVDLRDRPGLEDGLAYSIILDSYAADGPAVAVAAELQVFNAVSAEAPIVADDHDETEDVVGEDPPEADLDEDAEADDEDPPETDPDSEDHDHSHDDDLAEVEPPSIIGGYTIVAGSPVTSRQWQVTDLGADDGHTAEVVVVNPTGDRAEVTVEAITAGTTSEVISRLVVPSADRRTLHLEDLPETDDAVVLRITSTGAGIVVGRTVLVTEGDGIAAVLGSPMPGTVRTLPPVPLS